MTLALVLIAVNLFVAFLLYLRAQRMRQAAAELADYKATIAAKVNATIESADSCAVMHRLQIELLQTQVGKQAETIHELTEKYKAALNVIGATRVLRIEIKQPQKYWLN